jgi:mortality factor 4-like protein 1
MPRSWDDWVPEDRLRKLTQENRELAISLRQEMLAVQRAERAVPAPAKKQKAQASARGSEERQTSVAAAGPRGQKRLRDHDLEKVSPSSLLILSTSLSSPQHPISTNATPSMLLLHHS